MAYIRRPKFNGAEDVGGAEWAGSAAYGVVAVLVLVLCASAMPAISLRQEETTCATFLGDNQAILFEPFPRLPPLSRRREIEFAREGSDEVAGTITVFPFWGQVTDFERCMRVEYNGVVRVNNTLVPTVTMSRVQIGLFLGDCSNVPSGLKRFQIDRNLEFPNSRVDFTICPGDIPSSENCCDYDSICLVTKIRAKSFSGGVNGAHYPLASSGCPTTLLSNEKQTLCPLKQHCATIFHGTSGDDHIVGTDGIDIIYGNGGNDTIEALDGNDLIYTQGGDDIIDAGKGYDFVRSGGGDDTIDTGVGSDYVDSGSGDDTVILGKGSDFVNAGAGDDEVFGGKGDDFLLGDSGEDTIFGDEGDDRIYGGQDSDRLYGGAGDDHIEVAYDYYDFSVEYVNGGTGQDYIEGGYGTTDTILGGPGDDVIKTLGGYLNALYGNAGNDMIQGGTASDMIQGGSGNDSIEDTSGENALFGGSGDDTIVYSSAGGVQNDVRGGFGDDTIMDIAA
ncbi:hypothetical protein NDN08_007014 [Rhodosorus marinus]|uniref:Calcium-binding protein n=1 Tax=Rhodosorus marinus TaxID=101924 RepID=A0AAV8UJD7_9RHOD|nr:hypothetical protein NDN08_007014 [Rhodosorus marinus]